MKWMVALLSSFFLTLSISTAYAGMFDFFDSSEEVVEDSAITAEVKSELLKNQVFNDADYNTGNIQVETTNGMVLLTGKVKTEEQKMKAGEVAANAAGVTGVQNDLSVEPPVSSDMSVSSTDMSTSSTDGAGF
jgi:hypothetical protein